MYCYFSVSRSQMTAQSLSLLSILLLFLCELCTSETLSVFVVCYWRMLINFYIACTTIFQPVAAKWQLRVSPCYRFFFSSYVSYARLRLSLSLLFVIDACWLTFILHVLLFFSQSQPNDSSESLPAIDSSSLPMWVMHVWDSLSLLFVIAAYWLTFILRVLLFFSQSQPDDSSLLASSHALWVMPGWDSVFFFCIDTCMSIKFCIACPAIFQPVPATPQS